MWEALKIKLYQDVAFFYYVSLPLIVALLAVGAVLYVIQQRRDGKK